MAEGNHSCGLNNQKDQQAIQDAEIKERLSHIKNKILVMSGKGGVGKSTVAAFLAIALARKGHKVGLMDVDLHGPSIPRMLGLTGSILPSPHSNKAIPIDFMPNMHVISIEILMGENKDTATIWRGPLKIGVIRQFISDIEWSDLHYMIIDSPPGTGDEPLTVAQTIPDAKALIVTTPQEISLADVRKSINFCRQVKMEIIGLVENMSGFQCPHCGKNIDLFKAHGGQLIAKKENLRLLASLPIETEVVNQGDAGNLAGLYDNQLPFTREFNKMVEQIEKLTLTEASVPIKEQKEKKETAMNDKITFAIPVIDGKLCAHFGHCDQFALIETANGKIKDKSMHTPPPHEPGVLPKWLHEQGANIILAGGMGSRAQQLFEQNDIKVITGVPMDSPESLVNQYLSESLMIGENVCEH
ncbi:MAG: P-loop NTPase [Deltaproteobacteria bacterium]|nr:P-loop NTPase [Deltaproteobacteria bacterium]